MTYNELLTLLQAQDVCDRIREKEEAIFALIPELKVCKGFDQRNSWHIYDVYEHILHVIAGVEGKLLRLVALFHDVGKPRAFTLDAQGVGHFWGHWERSVEIFQKYAPEFDLTAKEVQLATALIFYHDVNVDKMSEAEIAEMMEKIGRENMRLLFAIKRADLLAQSSVYHNMLTNIQAQEQRLQKKE